MSGRSFAGMFFAFCLLILPLFFSGCSDKKPLIVSDVKIVSGENQCALPGHDFERELRIEVFGVPKGDHLLGGSSKPRSVPDCDLILTPVDGSGLILEKQIVRTDVTGVASVKIKAGKEVGDNYLKITPAGAEGKSKMSVSLSAPVCRAANRRAKPRNCSRNR